MIRTSSYETTILPKAIAARVPRITIVALRAETLVDGSIRRIANRISTPQGVQVGITNHIVVFGSSRSDNEYSGLRSPTFANAFILESFLQMKFNTDLSRVRFEIG